MPRYSVTLLSLLLLLAACSSCQAMWRFGFGGLLSLIGVNILQSGPMRPDGKTPDDILGFPRGKARHHHLEFLTKAELQQLFFACAPKGAKDQSVLKSAAYQGRLLFSGVLSPCTYMLTHHLWPPVLIPGRWEGKTFEANGTGFNRFRRGLEDTQKARPFRWSWMPSRYDGKPALRLNYRDKNRYPAKYDGKRDGLLWALLWGGMTDELRPVNGRLWIGLGSVKAFGGASNSSPFTLTL
ncbi:unnamed protein product [Chrysoparadoxa australica]